MLTTGLVLTAVLSWTSYTINDHNESRLLNLRVRETGVVLTGALPSVQTPLASAAEIAAFTDGSVARFDAYMKTYVGSSGPFVSVSLWRITSGGARMVASMGSPPELAAEPAMLASFFTAAAKSPLLSVIGLLQGPRPHLGYEFNPPGRARFVVYGESALPPSRRAPIAASSPFAGLNYALYLGRSAAAANLLETSVDRLPLAGRTSSVTVPFGESSFTLVGSPIGNFGGALLGYLAWIVAAAGAALTVAASFLAERLVRRREHAEALALENREMYREQRTIAEALQQALLPESLPFIPGMELGARFISGTHGVDIGGDWYDVIPLAEDRFMFVVGDVSGRGVRAAAVMARLQFAIRAYAAEGDDAASILGKLCMLLDVGRDGHFATVLCGEVDVGGHEVRLANAGHPAPLLMGGEEPRFLESVLGIPIGVSRQASYRMTAFAVPCGATLLAFTDGLIERRGEHADAGLDRLVEATSHFQGSFDGLLANVVELAPSGHDDTAILGTRWLS